MILVDTSQTKKVKPKSFGLEQVAWFFQTSLGGLVLPTIIYKVCIRDIMMQLMIELKLIPNVTLEILQSSWMPHCPKEEQSGWEG